MRWNSQAGCVASEAFQCGGALRLGLSPFGGGHALEGLFNELRRTALAKTKKTQQQSLRVVVLEQFLHFLFCCRDCGFRLVRQPPMLSAVQVVVAVLVAAACCAFCVLRWPAVRRGSVKLRCVLC